MVKTYRSNSQAITQQPVTQDSNEYWAVLKYIA